MFFCEYILNKAFKKEDRCIMSISVLANSHLIMCQLSGGDCGTVQVEWYSLLPFAFPKIESRSELSILRARACGQ